MESFNKTDALNFSEETKTMLKIKHRKEKRAYEKNYLQRDVEKCIANIKGSISKDPENYRTYCTTHNLVYLDLLKEEMKKRGFSSDVNCRDISIVWRP